VARLVQRAFTTWVFRMGTGRRNRQVVEKEGCGQEEQQLVAAPLPPDESTAQPTLVPVPPMRLPPRILQQRPGTAAPSRPPATARLYSRESKATPRSSRATPQRPQTARPSTQRPQTARQGGRVAHCPSSRQRYAMDRMSQPSPCAGRQESDRVLNKMHPSRYAPNEAFGILQSTIREGNSRLLTDRRPERSCSGELGYGLDATPSKTPMHEHASSTRANDTSGLRWHDYSRLLGGRDYGVQ